MTEESTNVTADTTDADKGNSQEEAFKRITKENADMKAKLAETKTEEAKVEVKEEPKVGSPEFIRQTIQYENKREAAVQKFLADFPESSEYEKEIRKRLNDPSRAKIPADEVIRGAIPMELIMKIGAKLQQEESESDSKTGMGGSDGNTKTKQTKAQEKAARHMASLPKGFKPKN